MFDNCWNIRRTHISLFVKIRSVSVSKNQEMVFYSFSFPMCLFKVGQLGKKNKMQMLFFYSEKH